MFAVATKRSVRINECRVMPGNVMSGAREKDHSIGRGDLGTEEGVFRATPFEHQAMTRNPDVKFDAEYKGKDRLLGASIRIRNPDNIQQDL